MVLGEKRRAIRGKLHPLGGADPGKFGRHVNGLRH
jgi:hypothetical protein